MTEKGKYIYGILALPGSPYSNSCYATDSLAKVEEITKTNGVQAIPHQDIAALISDSTLCEFSKALPKDILMQLFVKHQKVIESVMSFESTIIPMKLGTIVNNNDEVRNILRQGYGLTKEIIEKMKDKVEIDVIAIWSDFTSIIKEAGESSEIKELREKLTTCSQHITTDTQIQVGFKIKKVIDSLREDYAGKIRSALSAITRDFRQPELTDDKIIVNAGFLIEKDRQNDFYREIEMLNDQFDGKINFKCVGPLPAYTFYTLEIKKLQYEDLQRAKNRIGVVNDQVSRDDIRKAYHKAVFNVHPDKNPDKPEIKMEFEEVKKSYNLLLDYCQAWEQTGQGKVSFCKEDIDKNSILVKIRD